MSEEEAPKPATNVRRIRFRTNKTEPGEKRFLRGKDFGTFLVREDGTEELLPGVVSAQINCDGRSHALKATVHFIGIEFDVECLDDSDPVKIAMLQARHWEQEAKTLSQSIELKQESVDELWKENDELRSRIEALENRAVTVDAAREPSRVAKLVVAGMTANASVKIE